MDIFNLRCDDGRSMMLLSVERLDEEIDPIVSYEEPIFLLSIYLWLRVFPKSILLDKNFEPCQFNYNVCYVKVRTCDTRFVFSIKSRFANYSLNEPMHGYRCFDELIVPASWLSQNRLLSKIPPINDFVQLHNSMYTEKNNLMIKLY